MAEGDSVDVWLEEDFGELWRSFARTEYSDSERLEVRIEVDESTVEEDGRHLLTLAVVERDLPDGLFGFTRRDSSHVVVNRNLYRIDKERTVRHEKTHHRFPKDELTVRYINGDPDVRNTLSFQGNNPARLGRGSTGVSRGGAVAAYGPGKGYRGSYL